jgi:cytochrome c oxidase subunit 3
VAGQGRSGPLPRSSLYTALGGAIFVSLQAYEWTHLIHRGLHINGNPCGAALFGTSFFLSPVPRPARHGAASSICSRPRRLVARPARPAASYNMVEIVGLYWHFVDLVWIMVFTFMYLL